MSLVNKNFKFKIKNKFPFNRIKLWKEKIIEDGRMA